MQRVNQLEWSRCVAQLQVANRSCFSTAWLADWLVGWASRPSAEASVCLCVCVSQLQAGACAQSVTLVDASSGKRGRRAGRLSHSRFQMGNQPNPTQPNRLVPVNQPTYSTAQLASCASQLDSPSFGPSALLLIASLKSGQR